jgi:hypothetical protein
MGADVPMRLDTVMSETLIYSAMSRIMVRRRARLPAYITPRRSLGWNGGPAAKHCRTQCLPLAASEEPREP